MITVEFCNVGFGQCIIAYPPGKDHVLVIDGGVENPAEGGSPYAASLGEHLRRLEIEAIDLMIATHPHRDHIGGLVEAARQLPVRRFVTFFDRPEPAFPAGEHPMSQTAGLYRQLWELLALQGAQIQVLSERTPLQCGRIRLLVLSPVETLLKDSRRRLQTACQSPKDENWSALDAGLNDASMALRLEAEGTALLLTGDVSLSQWPGVPAGELAARILTAPHHGDSGALSASLLEAIRPEYAVVCADAKGTWGLPHPATEELLAAHGCQTLYAAGGRTDETAAGVRFLLEGGGLAWEWIR